MADERVVAGSWAPLAATSRAATAMAVGAAFFATTNDAIEAVMAGLQVGAALVWGPEIVSRCSEHP